MTATTQTTTLSEADHAKANLHLQQTRDLLLGSIKLLTPEQWRYQPAPERWSIAQIVDHVIGVQQRVRGMVQQRLQDAPPPPAGHDREVIDDIAINFLPNRLAKFPSPMPCESRFDKAEAVRHFTANCDAFAGLLASTPGLRDHVLESPPLRAISKGTYTVMDGYQWILAASGHTERHTKQILEVVADSAFPV